MGLLEGIDPNPDNFVTAGIIHTRQGQVGYLLRLEPNLQAQVSLFVITCKLLAERKIIIYNIFTGYH